MVAILLVSFTATSRAQYRVSDASIAGYFKIVVEGISIRSDNGLVTGLGFGFVLNRRTYIGLGGYGLFSSNITTATLDLQALDRARLYLVWGGLEFEQSVFRTGNLQVGLTSLLGVGNVEAEERLLARVVEQVQAQGRDATQKSNKDGFYLIDPGAILSYTPASWIQLSARAAYRIAFGVSYLTITDRDLGGLIWGIRASVGSF